jgi:hypothetical protein
MNRPKAGGCNSKWILVQAPLDIPGFGITGRSTEIRITLERDNSYYHGRLSLLLLGVVGQRRQHFRIFHHVGVTKGAARAFLKSEIFPHPA